MITRHMNVARGGPAACMPACFKLRKADTEEAAATSLYSITIQYYKDHKDREGRATCSGLQVLRKELRPVADVLCVCVCVYVCVCVCFDACCMRVVLV